MTDRRNLPTDDLLAYARAKAKMVSMKPGHKNQERLKAELLESTRRTFQDPQVIKRKVQVMNPRTPQAKVRDQQLSKKEFENSNLLGEDEALQDRMEQARAMRADIGRERLNQKQIPAQFSEVVHMRRKGPQNQDRRDQDGVKSPIYTDLDNSSIVDDIDEEELANLNINSDDEEPPAKNAKSKEPKEPKESKETKNVKSKASPKSKKAKETPPAEAIGSDDDVDDKVPEDADDFDDAALDLDDLDDIDDLDDLDQVEDLDDENLEELEEETKAKKKPSPKKPKKVYKKQK